MKKLFILLILMCTKLVFAQESGRIKGIVKDTNGIALSGATVQVNQLKKGTITDKDGNYSVDKVPEGKYTVTISFVGFESATQSVAVLKGKTAEANVNLQEVSNMLNDIVVTANKKPQKLTEVPATINIIRARDIAQFASFNIGELASRQKGVDYVRSGVLGTGINIRGFNSAFNSKNLQVTDDRLSSLIATGLPLGTFSTVTKDDIERVEILLGPNGTLYGPNAHNGVINSITKNPRTSEGTTFAIGAGNQNVLTARFRHAQVLSDKFAYKVHFERSQGTEFDYVDSVYIGTVGKPELELNRDFSTVKYGTGLYYKPSSNSEIVGYYGHSNNNNISITNAGRNQIKDWKIDEFQIKYISPRFFANGYYTKSNTENTYAINQRTQNYYSFVNNGFSEEESLRRSYAEQWVPSAGVAINRGSLFKDDSKRLNGEFQYNNNWSNFYLTLGTQYQKDMADSKGTYLLDSNGGINIVQTGFYSQFEYKAPESKWNFLLAGRLDNHELYGSTFLPKAAITKSFEKGTVRFTYGNGISVPSILNLKGNLFGGLIIGNGEGFTLKDGKKIAKLEVETISTYEVGYKGSLSNKLTIDVNAYYNKSKNFISPLRNIASAANPVTHVGDQPIGTVVPGSTGTFILTYSNFGQVDTYGFDLGLNYAITPDLGAVFNYSYFGRDLDKNDLKNDGNLDGIVLETELPINTPQNKFNVGLNYNKNRFYGSMYARWIQKYDFFSGINIAAKTQDLNGDGTNDVIVNARKGRTWNYGQLGGFSVDANMGYNFANGLTLGVSVTNLLNAKNREFVASPIISTLYAFELKYNVNFFKSKKAAIN
ncbi:TonB-dependent receptor [Flavobacterium sp. RSP46]|uniref:TonB-dependent receptor n=1 Tax=Flavobacterium sp. RSP46 TaxID=2497486 RepID=UPI000F85DFC1|nr:TonB-dependent receptor [Flavobacterium sp. RSP46]RTY89761.1 TonB-dependent receptor [Flavobacterium sp. RSP46]